MPRNTLLDRRFLINHPLQHSRYAPKIWGRQMPNVEFNYQTQVQNKIILGTTEPYGQGDLVSIPRYEVEGGTPTRQTIFVLGFSGAGKSKLVKFIAGQALALGESLAVVSDPKNEWACVSQKPPKAKKGELPKGYYTRAAPTRSYIPEYIVGSRLPSDIKRDMVFNFKLSDLEINDMKTLLGIRDDSLDQVQANMSLLLDATWTNLKEKLGDGYESRTLADLENVIREMPTQYSGEGFAAKVTKAKLLGKLQTLKTQKIFGEKGINQVQDILEGRIPVLVSKYSQFENYDRVYASIFMRQLYNAKMSGVVRNPLWYIVDESQRIMSRASCSLITFVDLILRMGRQKLMHAIASSQTFSASGSYRDAIPTEVLSQFSHILVWRIQSREDLDILCKARGIDQYDWRRKLLQELDVDHKNGVFEACWVKPNGECTTFYTFRNPILNHTYEG